MQLTGKVFVITGAESGIGKAAAVALGIQRAFSELVQNLDLGKSLKFGIS